MKNTIEFSCLVLKRMILSNFPVAAHYKLCTPRLASHRPMGYLCMLELAYHTEVSCLKL